MKTHIKYLIEKNYSIDVNEFLRGLKILHNDLKQEEPILVKIMKDLHDRINQTNPDGDITPQIIWASIKGSFMENKYKKRDIQEVIDMMFDIY